SSFSLFFFFFSSRRRHTRFSRDWSSDVCSSDLFFGKQHHTYAVIFGCWCRCGVAFRKTLLRHILVTLGLRHPWLRTFPESNTTQIGRASCREREKISGSAVTQKKKKE